MGRQPVDRDRLMMRPGKRRDSAKHVARGHCGFSLLEVVIAVAILWIVSTALLAMFGIALARTNTFGNDGTRTAEYAMDKMEALMGLGFSDPGLVSGSDTCSTDQGCGTNLTNIQGRAYSRVWTVSQNDAYDSTNIKTITVTVTVTGATQKTDAPATAGAATTLVCDKVNKYND